MHRHTKRLLPVQRISNFGGEPYASFEKSFSQIWGTATRVKQENRPRYPLLLRQMVDHQLVGRPIRFQLVLVSLLLTQAIKKGLQI